jgi:hypothetical protein
LTITLKNSYAQAAKLEAPLIDNMPKGMVVYGSAKNTCGGSIKATKGTSTATLTGGAIPAKGSCTVTVKVTAPCNNYFNNLPAGALQTSNGNNQEPSGASLTVNEASLPALAKPSDRSWPIGSSVRLRLDLPRPTSSAAWGVRH